MSGNLVVFSKHIFCYDKVIVFLERVSVSLLLTLFFSNNKNKVKE